jgi:predicted small metal-binding protein
MQPISDLMKQFACGSVVPGCQAVFEAPDEAGILSQVERHARQDHGLTEISDDLVAGVRDNITTIAA